MFLSSDIRHITENSGGGLTASLKTCN